MVNIGPLPFYVSIKITRDWIKKTIKLSQPGYIKKLLDRHVMLKAKTTKTPMQENLLLLYDKLVSSNKKTKYISKIKSILYTIIETKINCIFAISIVSHFTKNPGLDHFSIIDQILKYLASSSEKNITFERKSKLNYVEYSNSDWAEDYSDRKSILGFILLLIRDLLVIVQRKKQW